MKLNCHPDTDFLYIGLSPNPSADSNEVAEAEIKMTEGDVALTPLPQADGRVKPRPGIFCAECRFSGTG
ncbi:MAG: hypothetical protein ACR2NX_16340 [Chthoniobacterales bacterium]